VKQNRASHPKAGRLSAAAEHADPGRDVQIWEDTAPSIASVWLERLELVMKMRRLYSAVTIRNVQLMSAFGRRPQAFVLHGFQPPPPPSGDFVASAISKIVLAIDAIFGSEASDLSYQELHCATYNMVIQRQGESLCNAVCQSFKDRARAVASQLANCSDTTLLSMYVENWRSYSIALHVICSFLMYMDHNYCSVLKKPSLYRVGINVFLEVASEPALRQRVTSILLGHVSSFRSGAICDLEQLRAVVLVLLQMVRDGAMNEYDLVFESPYLHNSAHHYATEAARLLQACSGVEYARAVEAAIDRERTLCSSNLAPCTFPKVIKVIQSTMIDQQTIQVLQAPNSGLDACLNADRLDALTDLYKCVSRADTGLASFVLMFKRHVEDVCKGLVASETMSSPVVFVQQALALSRRFKGIIDTCFGSRRALHDAFVAAMTSVCNSKPGVPEALSLYLDRCVRNPSSTDGSSTDVVERVMQLFRFIGDKDVFQSYYISHMAQRILASKGYNEEYERIIIESLKKYCGFGYTHKMERMFKDAEDSLILAQDWADTIQNASLPLQVPANLLVLTAGVWPQMSESSLKLPPSLQAACDNFSSWYTRKFGKQRNLLWRCHLGSADLKCTYGDRAYTITMPVPCMTIMLQFDECSGPLSLKQLVDFTGIHDAALLPFLDMLTSPQHPLLAATSGTWFVNQDFSSKHIRFSLQKTGVLGNFEDEALKVTKSKVAVCRDQLLDAAIVRIVKSRKIIAHSALLNEVCAQLTAFFEPRPSDIKKVHALLWFFCMFATSKGSCY
jgi:cullin 3